MLVRRGLCPLALLALLEDRLSHEILPTTVDRTFDGARDGLYAIALAWNRVLRPTIVPLVWRVREPVAFGGEAAVMRILGVEVEVYFARESGVPRIRLGTQDVALPPKRRLALALVASAVGDAAIARERCPCDRR